MIIGRNNSGKSTLLDLIEFAANPYDISNLGHRRDTKPQVIISQCVSDLPQKDGFVQLRADRGRSSQVSMRTLCHNAIGKVANFELTYTGGIQCLNVEDVDWSIHPDLSAQAENWFIRQYKVSNPFDGYSVRRLLADRDLQPEAAIDSGSVQLQGNGSGATQVIQAHLHVRGLQRELVELDLLDQLNEILGPDASITRVITDFDEETKKWEVCLEEPRKGLIPLSSTGSGVKTILLVLLNVIFGPRLVHSELSKCIFCFEELENNLHPAAQRRLYECLRKLAVKDGARFFITTHSSVVIDFFSRDPEAQLLHVKHDGESAQSRTVSSQRHGRAVVRDLDVRASDLLQANVIVWVEGPSDRVYFNRWIELWTNAELQEHAHYECMSYGGSLIANISFADSQDTEQIEQQQASSLIQALNINHNAIVLLDSDKNSERDKVKGGVARIVREVEQVNGIAWVTAGREIENYLPTSVFRTWVDDNARGPSKFGSVFEYLKKKSNLFAYKNRKHDFALAVRGSIDLEGIRETLDLAERLDCVCKRIREWNHIPASPTNQTRSSASGNRQAVQRGE